MATGRFHSLPIVQRSLSRREMLRQAGLGFGGWAMLDLLMREGRLSEAAAETGNPLAAKPPHFAARAKHAVLLYM